MCKSDQEIINNYLANNPLKAKQRKQDKSLSFPCAACGGRVYSVKKRPVTPFTGGLLDKFANKVEGFPTEQEEDLCNNCIGAIRNSNMSVDSQVTNNNWDREYTGNVPKLSEMFTENLDAEQLENENSYQGYSSLEQLEGLSVNTNLDSDKPLKL